MKKFICSTLIALAAFALSACVRQTTPSTTPTADVVTPPPPVSENTSVQPGATSPMEWFSSDQPGLCFSYPQGFTQLPESGTLEIVAPELPGTDSRGIFWLETSGAYDRTAEVIADQELTFAAGVAVDRSTITLDGEQAVVLDGMPGQDLQRKVYVVHQQTLYVLSFMPTRSENKEAGAQVEALYTAITNSWTWSPCSASE